MALLLSIPVATPLLAQPPSNQVTFAPAWTGDVTFIASNALVGGLTAGVLQELRGGSFQDGFARGALGGAIAYAGRRVAVEDFSAAGLIGRQVSAVGVSIVRNASERQPMFARVLVPIGPLLLYVQRDRGRRVHARLDAVGAAWLFAGILDDRLDLDWRQTISAGAPVFNAPDYRIDVDDGDAKLGISVGGLVVLGEGGINDDVRAHERVHVLQYDFAREVWNGPLETWLAGFIPGGARVLTYVEPGLAGAVAAALFSSVFDVDWRDRPWETEAAFLDGR